MEIEEEFDFAVIANNLFLKNDTDVNFIFAVTWKEKSKKLIINCKEFTKRGNQNQGITKIKSFTISEFEALHKELCAIESKIEPYFPNNFTFKTFDIVRPYHCSWNFFSVAPTSYVDQEKDFSDETSASVINYLRAVAELCGQKLLFNVFFKEDNETYYEDHDKFIKKESKKKIQQCESDCYNLLSSHNDFLNLQTLTEDLYLKEDLALAIFQDALFNDSLMLTLPLTEESQTIKEKLEKVLFDLQVSDIGPKMLTELKVKGKENFQQYYECYKQILHIKITLSKRQRNMYLKYLKKMKEDQDKYQIIIYRDCAGLRMSKYAENFHKENEKLCQFYLDLHSTEDIIVMRKIELLELWAEGQEMVKPSVRHEDVSLIQLKNLDRSNIEVPVLEEYHSYISETYRLLLEYNESQRLGLDNKKHIIDDPLDIILPKSRKLKNNLQRKPGEKDSLQSINYSGLLDRESESDFEDALDEYEFGNLKKTENKKLNLKNECESKLKEIANKKAELRNSKARLNAQYEKLIKKITEKNDNNYESLQLESLHPEKNGFKKKSTVGTSLTSEQRKAEARKARDRIKKYQEKLKMIPENKILVNSKLERNKSGISGSSKLDQDFMFADSIPIPQSNIPQVILPSSLSINIPPPPPINIPPPPPINIPPPPPINIPPPPPNIKTLLPSQPANIVIKSNIPAKSSNMSYIDELQMAFIKRKVARTSSNIDEEVMARKQQNNIPMVGSLSSVVDSRRKFFNSEDETN